MGSLEITGQSITDHVHPKIQSLREFIDTTKKTFSNGDLDGHPNVPNLPEILAENNFYSCPLKQVNKWPDVHKWCEWQFGRDHYVWIGNIFWFETEQDQILFMLTWG